MIPSRFLSRPLWLRPVVFALCYNLKLNYRIDLTSEPGQNVAVIIFRHSFEFKSLRFEMRVNIRIPSWTGIKHWNCVTRSLCYLPKVVDEWRTSRNSAPQVSIKHRKLFPNRKYFNLNLSLSSYLVPGLCRTFETRVNLGTKVVSDWRISTNTTKPLLRVPLLKKKQSPYLLQTWSLLSGHFY